MVVGVFETGLHPVLVVDAHEHPCLVELAVPRRAERDLHRLSDGERGEQRVFGVVHEAVGGVPPGVAALYSRDVEVFGSGRQFGGGGGSVRPGSVGPGDDVRFRHVLNI